MTHTLFLGVGSVTTRIILSAYRQVLDRGRADRASAVVAFGEDPSFYDADRIPGLRWHRLPSLRTTLTVVAHAREDYPWIDDKGFDAMRAMSREPGDGLAASPGAGRCAVVGAAPDLYNSIRAVRDEVNARGDELDVLVCTSLVGGSSSGSLAEAGLLARSACSDEQGESLVRVRNVLVLPSFAIDAHPHEVQRRADNALQGLRMAAEGVAVKKRWFTGRNGREEMVASLADEFVLVNPAYQADDHARVKALTTIDQVVSATARILAGYAGGETAWQALQNRTMDSTAWRVDGEGAGARFRWVNAVNEARVYFDDQRLRAGVMHGLLQPTA